MKEEQLELFDFEDEYSLDSLIGKEYFPNENYELEYKSAQDGFPTNEFWKTYSAFANTNTGVIILGISEKRHALTVEGLTDEQIAKYKKHFWDGCNNSQTVSCNLLTNNDVKVITFKDKKLLTFRVPFAARTERPVFLTRNPFGNTYKRNHEGDYRCTDEEIKRMMADSTAELKRDGMILEHFTVEDLDPLSIKQFRQLFLTSRPAHPWHILDDLTLLQKVGAYGRDRKKNVEGLTLAGLLMFGKEDSIKEQEALPDYFPDFREKLSSDKNIRWTDRIYPDGTFECNLLQFYLKVLPKISSTLPKPFRLQGDERIDETLTHIALREAFVNALVHADYSLNGNIIVELDTEKFVFSNPGTLLISLQQYYAGGISECRNPALQKMFMLIGRAEKAGSGVDKIMAGWNDAHWRKPYLEINTQPDRVKLTLPMFSVIPDSIIDELNDYCGDVQHLSSDELTVLSFCLIEGNVSNNRMQYVLGMHRTDITALLKRLCDRGYLESDDNRRWTLYTLKKVDTSDRKVDTSNRKVDTSSRKVDTSGRKVDTRLSKDDLEGLIMQICKKQYVRMEEVANITGKSFDYLKNKIFPRMIKEGKLMKRFPYTDNHPQQGYKTTDDYAEQL
jgi:predicted HTH transcriptional regulator